MHEDQLARLCRGLPGATTDIKWDHDRVWSVGGKMFAVLVLDGPQSGRLSFKVADDRFLELTDLQGVHPAPYLARAHWISLSPGHVLSDGEVEALLKGSYELVRSRLPKKLRETLTSE
ncbi:MmcQ/YjbR family DNA-binding protein [Pseudomarimonas salicorniae]|uniref:MmcQ/YjbR family DNA-binding protein n=1 Tax=Pseudomarimonas salicorniae TaxID=2933270 RepID=A0ABT0GL26_9GAMM|nr:MmcQ/YjbR family DNA-binding protein [Lysobacter sp. CAU 1642]MCK7594735.1 MmcQ/YjbR family DNA-binding protein [Lysobacter sp. CAU 1642]